MPLKYTPNEELTARDGVPWFDEHIGHLRIPRNWQYELPGGGTVWGRAVYEVRALHGVTQEELADALGVTARTVYNWESGRAVPSRRRARVYWRQVNDAVWGVRT